MQRNTTAKFLTRCPRCGATIYPGDRITYDPRVKHSAKHEVCPRKVAQNPTPKVAPGTLLNSPVIAQPQVARLSDEEAREILAELGSEWVRPLPAGQPTLGIGYKLVIDGVERTIGTANDWVGVVTDHKGRQSWTVSLIDGAVLDHCTADPDWMNGALTRCTRELGAPLKIEIPGKGGVEVGDVRPHHGRWYMVISVDRPYYISAEEAEDMDLFGRGGGWTTPYEVREITEPREAREEREAQEAADRATAERLIGLLRTARERAVELLPLGIRPLTRAEHDLMWASINGWKQTRDGRPVLAAESVLDNPRPEDKLSEPVAADVRAALGGNWDRLPAMDGNPDGVLGWSHIYRVGERFVVEYCDCTPDGPGATLQGISVAAEDAPLMADMARRKAIQGYRFHPDLYAAITRGNPSPSPCYDVPEAERACTRGAYGRERNQTAAELREELVRQFQGDDAVLAILAREDSVTEIRRQEEML